MVTPGSATLRQGLSLYRLLRRLVDRSLFCKHDS